ncbi:MAG: tRNA (adenosine(37)-N6)-threonylcarbamoyltransferase complex dimerization subunit type 1 TsaB, partial [Selenomonadaceae bacterium]
VVIIGDIAQKKQALIRAAGSNIIAAQPHMIMPRAANVAMLAQQKLAAGRTDEVMTLEPLYIRRSEAEVLWEKRQQKQQA